MLLRVVKLPLHLLLLLQLLLLLAQLAVQVTGTVSDAEAASVSDKDCQNSRERFPRFPMKLILKNMLSADVVLESGAIKDADMELISKRSITVPINCFHKGYLKSHQLTVDMHKNFTRCIDMQALETVLANEGQFVFFLRRMKDDGQIRWVMLEGGLAPAEAFNDRSQFVCSIQNATANSSRVVGERICPRTPAPTRDQCQPLIALRNALLPSNSIREPFWEKSAATDAAATAGGGSDAMPNDGGRGGGGDGGGGDGASYARGKPGSSTVRTAAAASAGVVWSTAALLVALTTVT